MPKLEPAIPSGTKAQSILAHSAFLALRNLRVTETRGALILTGSVTSYYSKQLAQELMRSAAAGRQLINRIRVAKPAVPQDTPDPLPFPSFDFSGQETR